jgi:molybdopterin converting factor small subunit
MDERVKGRRYRMTIKILLFASAADIAGRQSVSVEVPAGATIADAAAAVRNALPELSRVLDVSRWAIDCEFVPLTASLAVSQEVALIPPVSGG